MCKVNDFKILMNKEIHFTESLDSTNKEAMHKMQQLDGGLMHVFYTHHQTAGRGQGDHIWEAEKAENVLMSILLKNQLIPLEHQFGISHAVALALCDFVSEELTNAKINIKWPNDILINGKKCAGILVENSSMGDHINSIIAGMGLNFNQNDFPEHLPDATSLFLHDARERDIERSVQRIAELFDVHFENVLNEKWDELLQNYNARLWKRGEQCSFSGKDGAFNANILGTETDGKILLEFEDGTLQGFYHHEVRMGF